MASMGSGYDLSVATFSPDGRVFQVEYATKAVEATGLAVGAIFKDGVLLAVDKYLPSAKLVVPTTSSRVFKLAPHVICAVAGVLPDARQLVARARLECSEYEGVWGVPISGAVLADRIGHFVHAHTSVWSTRPFGCSILIAVADKRVPEPFPVSGLNTSKSNDDMAEPQAPSPSNYSLWLIDPTGAAYKYRGTAIAKGSNAAKSDLEKLKLNELTCEQGLFEFAKVLHQGHAEIREREMKMEMIWIRASDNDLGDLVPENLLNQADRDAKEHLERLEID